MQILGHRGACADAPENTLEAFAEAMRQGAVGFELDVMQCATGELVVCHDEKLDRLARRPNLVVDTSWAELQTFDVGTPLGFAPARIPLLRAVLEAHPTALVNVELKCDEPDDRGLSVSVGRLLVELNAVARVFVSSFNPRCLLNLTAAYPQFKRGLLIDPDQPWQPQMEFLPTAASTSIHPHFSACTPERVREWHARGLEVAVWTVNDSAEAKRLEAMGVDWVITNVPGQLRSALGRRG